jgi:WD40 repeat protein/tRNA A-37 threonylcarbamoyl transferase component Bud32
MSELLDSTLGKYQVVSLIGRGGMAEVYQAYQPGLDRYVAVKVLHPHLAEETGFVGRFEREAASVARLRHPNIVQVIDFDCQDERYYMVMEFIEGSTLRAECEERGEPYQAEEAAYVISGIASGLDYAHSRGMVHRDVKPGNIMFTGEGQVVLTDFGIAHMVGTTLYTESGTGWGTPAYMAPEQGRGDMGDARSDVYSLGVVLYEMLTGCLPYEAETPLGMIQQHVEGGLPAPRTVNPELSENIEAVILKAMAVEAGDRYQSAGEMADAMLIATGLTPEKLPGMTFVPRTAEVLVREEAVEKPLPPCPYRGLYAFREQDAGYFFGREVFTDGLIEAVEERSLVAVVGASGSGKSSVVNAGLLPQLRQASALRGAQGRAWAIADFRPGVDPFYGLATALLPLLETELSVTDQLVEIRKLAGALNGGEVLLSDVVEQFLHTSSEHGRLLLVIDQFEELYTLVPEAETQRRFVDLLLEAVNVHWDREGETFVLLLVMRADFLGQALSHRGFSDALQTAALNVGPMTRWELAQVIENPARKQGVSFESGLIERILDDVGVEPGNLPLLEFALTQLWEQQATGALSHAAYEAIGRVQGAVAGYADQVFAGLDASQQELARRAFTQMVRPGEGTEDTRRLALREELGDEEWELVQELADARLVVTGQEIADGQETVEVVHEALIQNWDQLRGWMTADRAFRSWQERLRAAMHAWEASERDEGALLRGGPLAEAEDWLAERSTELSEAEQMYIEESVGLREHRQATRERRRRVTIFALVGGLIIALVLAFWANSQRMVANDQRVIADEQRMRAEVSEQDALLQASVGLAGQADAVLQGGSADLAALLAMEALENYPYTWQAERALGHVVLGSRLDLILEHESGVSTARWSPDGSRILTVSDEGEVMVWDGDTGEMLLAISRYTGEVPNVLWSPDGESIATAGLDGKVEIWDASTGEGLLTIVPGGGGEGGGDGVTVTAIAFSPDSTSLVTGSSDSTTAVWDVTGQDGKTLTEPIHTLTGYKERVNDIAWSPDGSGILVVSTAERFRVYDAVTGDERMSSFYGPITSQTSAGRNYDVKHANWSPGGERIFILYWTVTGQETAWGFVETFRVEDDAAQELFRLPFDFWYRPYVQISPDADRLATHNADEVIVWDAFTGEEIYRLNEPTQFEALDWSPDSMSFVTGGSTGNISVWDANMGARELSLKAHENAINSMHWSPDGGRILSASADGTAKVWEVIEAPLTLIGTSGSLCAAWSPGGERIASGFSGGSIIVWDRGGGEVLSSMQDTGLMEQGQDMCHISWSPDGSRFVIVGQDAFPRVWEPSTGEKVYTLFGHSDIVHGLAWSADGSRIVTASQDKTVRIWDGETGQELQSITVGGVEGFAHPSWSPDGKQVLVIADYGDKNSLIVLDGEGGEISVEHRPEGYDVLSAAWSPDGERVAAICDDDRIRVWDKTLDELVSTIPDVKVPLGQPVWTLSGERILVGGGDGVVRMWDVSTGEELLSYPVGGEIEVRLSPDGEHLLVVQLKEDTLLVFPMWETLDELMAHAEECCLLRELTPGERTRYGLPER